MTDLVVLDACVLYPMYLRDTLLRAAEAGLYEARWSADILLELRRNLVADVLTEEQVTRLLSAMFGAFLDVSVTGYEPLIPAMRNDPKDRHVLAAAVRAGASVIVTLNLRDFAVDALEPFGVVAQSPDDFLLRLYEVDPEAVMSLLSRQAASYVTPPRSIDEVLNRLYSVAPTFATFVALVRQDTDAGT